MSWASTALYYDHINRGIAQRLGGLHSARLVIESLDMATIAEMELSGDWDGVARATLEAAKRLQTADAEGVIIAFAGRSSPSAWLMSTLLMLLSRCQYAQPAAPAPSTSRPAMVRPAIFSTVDRRPLGLPASALPSCPVTDRNVSPNY